MPLQFPQFCKFFLFISFFSWITIILLQLSLKLEFLSRFLLFLVWTWSLLLASLASPILCSFPFNFPSQKFFILYLYSSEGATFTSFAFSSAVWKSSLKNFIFFNYYPRTFNFSSEVLDSISFANSCQKNLYIALCQKGSYTYSFWLSLLSLSCKKRFSADSFKYLSLGKVFSYIQHLLWHYFSHTLGKVAIKSRFRSV